MAELSASLSAQQQPGRVGTLCGRLLARLYRIAGRHRYDDYRLETCGALKLLVLPSVANPRLLRTGNFFASTLGRDALGAKARVLDLGTGSGVCALAAAGLGASVVASDINPAAVRCARINALMNGLEHRVELRCGDLFAPVAGQRFDLVLFNPPFLSGVPRNHREAAWRSSDIPQRFASDLAGHLNPGGSALLLLSTFGDACTAYETELRQHGFRLAVHARRRYINETLTIVRAARLRPVPAAGAPTSASAPATATAPAPWESQ